MGIFAGVVGVFGATKTIGGAEAANVDGPSKLLIAAIDTTLKLLVIHDNVRIPPE